MAFPLALITKLIKPAIGLIVSKDPTGTESVLAKNWRPYTMASFVVLIVISFFTNLSLSPELLAVIGAVMVTYVGGRSFEKKAIPQVLKIIAENEKQKAKQDKK